MNQRATRLFSLTRSQRYGIAVVGVLLTALFRLLLDPILGDDLPLFLFLFPIVLVGWWGGLGPGLLATTLSLLLGDYLFIAPRGAIFQGEAASVLSRTWTLAAAGTIFSILFDRIRKAVKAQLECLERFGLLIDSVEDYAIFTMDPQGHVSCWNTGAERIEGYREKEVVGRDFSMFYTREDVETSKPRNDLEIARAHGRYVEEGWQIRKDGTRFWSSGELVALRDPSGQLRGFARITRDMTERKLAEDALQESQRFVQHIIDVSPSMICIYDVLERKVIFINRSIAAALGYPAISGSDQTEFIRSVIHPDDLQPFLDHLGRMTRLPDDETAEFLFRLRHHNGEWRWFQSRDKVFKRNEDGTVLQIIGTATDVTERKNTEDKARFISELDEALQPLDDPAELTATGARMLAEYLNADRCVYAEVDADADHFVVNGEYVRRGVQSIAGRFRISDFGDKERQMLQDNAPYVANDIDAVDKAATDLSLFWQEGVRALVSVPLNENGHLVATMVLYQSTPRQWSEKEIQLITVVANRCRELVERARAIRRLKDSDERYRTFITYSSEAIWRFELEKPIPVTMPEDEQLELFYQSAYLAECNDAMARMYGYESADQILGTRIGDLLVKSDPANVALLSDFKRSGYWLTDGESHEVDRHGNEKYFLNNMIGIQENGMMVRAWGTQRDITNQKQAEIALRASEERLRRITDATHDALWEIDLRTNQLWWSEGARPLFGRSPAELHIGLEDWYNEIHPEDADRVRAKFESFLHGPDRDWFDEYRFERADGSYVDIHDKGRKFVDENGAPVWIAGAMADITVRKRAEEALRESEERYRLLIELSPDGVVIAGADGTLHLANASMLRMLATTPEQVSEHNLFDFLAPEFLIHCRDCMKMLMVDGKTPAPIEAAFRRSDGGTFPVEINAVRFDWKGQPFAQIVIHDLSARKQAEAERERLLGDIEAERDRLIQMLEQMPIGVTIAEAPSGRMFFNNLEAVRLLRQPMPPSQEYKASALHQDGTPFRQEEYPGVRSLQGGEVIKAAEMRYRRGDGTETVFSVSSAPIYDSNRRMVLTIVTFIDIAERKQAEQALRESEERFAKAFQSSPDALVISRIADGIILEANDSFISLSGYERSELIGQSTVELDMFADPAVRENMVKLLKEQNCVRDFEFEMKRKSGELRLMSFSAEPLDLHGEHCWLTIGRDITERKHAEEALRHSEEEARRQLAHVEAIYASAPVGLCFVDTNLRYRSINERLAALNGTTVEAHLGHTLREIMPEIADAVEPNYRKVIETGKPVFDVELSRANRAGGPDHHFMVSYYPIRKGKGQVLGVNVVVVDITQRKQVEEEREQLLQQEKSAREEAETASRMKDEFLATISHELRTPLTSILGWSTLLGGGSLTESQTRRALQVIEQSARSQARLVDDILDTSRIITGRLKLETRPVEIDRVFQAAVEVVRPSAEVKGIALRAIIDDRNSMVFGDGARLQQVIWNLLSNAIKFTNEGGRVEARLARTRSKIEITVSDTGMGIDPEFLPHVFDRFRQADSTSTRRYGGLGLGLAIVRHIVELHGGYVSASSPGKGQGASFKVTLPLASAERLAQRESPSSKGESKQAAEPASLAERQLEGLRVLVVEDDRDTLDMLRFILKESGAEVITAASTSEGLKALERWRPNALVSDLAMPNQDGYEFIGQVRSRDAEHGGNIPAVALSAYTRVEDRIRALAAGFQMHVPKPVDPKELVAVVASLTGLNRS
jgi:PAS domain S-box-containing protein